MSRKAFFLLLIVRIDSNRFIGGDCLKSQIFLSENRESAFGLVMGLSLARTFRTVWGRRPAGTSLTGAAESERYSSMSERETPSEREALSERDAPSEREVPSERKLRQSEKFRQNATLMPPTMRPVIPMPSSTKPRTLCPPAWTQTAPA